MTKPTTTPQTIAELGDAAPKWLRDTEIEDAAERAGVES